MFYAGGLDCCLRLVDAGFDLDIVLDNSGMEIVQGDQGQVAIVAFARLTA